MVRALRANHAVCLLCDRDLDGGGVEVEFFGERTTLPAGPATLALRTGAPLLPAACYYDGRYHRCEVLPAVPVERRGRLQDDVTRVTQDLAGRLEDLIRAAPQQWHLLQPNWPSDRALAPLAPMPVRPRRHSVCPYSLTCPGRGAGTGARAGSLAAPARATRCGCWRRSTAPRPMPVSPRSAAAVPIAANGSIAPLAPDVGASCGAPGPRSGTSGSTSSTSTSRWCRARR